MNNKIIYKDRIPMFEAFLKRSDLDKNFGNKLSGYSSKSDSEFPILANQIVMIMCRIFDEAIKGYVAIKTSHIDAKDIIDYFVDGKSNETISYISKTSIHDKEWGDLAKKFNDIKSDYMLGDWEDDEESSKRHIGLSFTKKDDVYGMTLHFHLKSLKDSDKILDRNMVEDATAEVTMTYRDNDYVLYDGNDPLGMNKYSPTSFSDMKDKTRSVVSKYGVKKFKNEISNRAYKNILTSMLGVLVELDIEELNEVSQLINDKLKAQFEKEERILNRKNKFREIVEKDYSSKIEMLEDIEDEMMDLFDDDPAKFIKLTSDEYDEFVKTNKMKVFSLKEVEDNIITNKRGLNHDKELVVYDFDNLFIQRIFNKRRTYSEPDYGYGHTEKFAEDIIFVDVDNKKYYFVKDHAYSINYAGRAYNGD